MPERAHGITAGENVNGRREMAMLLIVAGVLMAGAGILLLLSDKVPFLGKLPGDLTLSRGNMRLHIPIATSIVFSVVLTLLFWGIEFLRRK